MVWYVILLFLNVALCEHINKTETSDGQTTNKTISPAPYLISEDHETIPTTPSVDREMNNFILGIIKSPKFPGFYQFNNVYKWTVGDAGSKLEFTLYPKLISLTENSYIEFSQESAVIENVTSKLLQASDLVKVQTHGVVSITLNCPDINVETLPFWFYYRDTIKVPVELNPIVSGKTGNISSAVVNIFTSKYFEYIWIIDAPQNSRIHSKIKIKQKSSADSVMIGSGLFPHLGSKNIIIGGISVMEREFTIENEHAYIFLKQFDHIDFELDYNITGTESVPKPPPTSTAAPVNSNVHPDDLDYINFLMRGFHFANIVGWKIEPVTVATLRSQFAQMGRKYCEDENILLDKELTAQDILLTFTACKATCREPASCLQANLSIGGTVNDSKVFSEDILIVIVSDYWSFTDLTYDFDIACSFHQWALWSGIIILIAVLSPALIICKWRKICSPYKIMKESKVPIETKADEGERYENMGWNSVSKASTVRSDTFQINHSYESSEDEDEDELFDKRNSLAGV